MTTDNQESADILIVDDSRVIREQVGKALEGAGHVCDYAENGIEAIKFSLGRSYRLIITDINMPVLDGLKFLHRIRASTRNSAVPVLILSSQRELECVQQAKILAVKGYILKPVDPESLLERVEQVLNEPLL